MDMCQVCPFRGHPTIVGASVKTGHTRFCQLLDPSHPDYNPFMEVVYREMTSGLNDVTPESCGVLTTRYIKKTTPLEIPQERPGRRIPKPGEITRPIPRPRPTQPHRASGGVRMLEDDQEHQRVYQSAKDCPHGKQDISCCGPVTRCGPEGTHPGQVVGMGTCYPCSMGRLGIQAGPVDTIDGE